ncbi:hypothetical protein ZWY2020_031944 [Hordeum vulgare]|nr:hypothetical protein ZWY2020_031944 [Hordeum vulgare]
MVLAGSASAGWMMLDRFIYRRDEDGDGRFPDESTAPLRATSSTSHGQPFDIAILHAEPPAVSRLYLRWPDDTKGSGAAELAAAHRDLLLFRLVYFDLHLTYDHFLCVASSDPVPHIELKRLPLCTIPMVLPPFFKEDTVEPMTTHRWFLSNTVGLVRGSSPGHEDEFVLAQLASITNIPGTHDLKEAEVCVLRSRVSATNDEGTWELQKIPIQHKEHQYWRLDDWSTSAVTTFNNLICWICYYTRGILFYDVFAETPRISYLRLPTHNRPLYRERGFLEVNRSICVTDGGDALKYTNVVRTDDRLCSPLEHREGYRIIADILKTTEVADMEWVREPIVTASEFWRHNTSERLPRDAVPEYPLVSMDDPSIIYFLLSEEEEKINKVSVVTMDMVTNKMISVFPYIKGEEDLYGEDADMVQEKSHLLKSFLTSEFPKFLNLTRDC